MSESRARRWWGRFREAISVAADLWDAVKLVALFAALVLAALAGTAVFAFDVMPTALLALFVVGIAGLAFVLLQPLARKVLPVQPDPAPPTPALSNPYAGAAALQRNYQDTAGRKALRLIREELLDNKHALDRYLLDNDLGALRTLQFGNWNEQREALLAHDDPRPHEKASEAYRRLIVFHGLFFRRSQHDHRLHEPNPSPDHPVDDDVRAAIDAIQEGAAALGSAEEARKPTA